MKLTTEHAQVVLGAAAAKAAEIRIPVNIALLDAGGNLKAFLRMDGAVLGSIDVALKKARTAVLFQVDSASVWDYCKPGAPAEGLQLTNGGLVTFAGGMPIKSRDGELIGAIGISGGQVFQDAQIAEAGVAAFPVTCH